jgi:hypothetical protein
MAIVARLLRGESLELVARETNISIARLTAWTDAYRRAAGYHCLSGDHRSRSSSACRQTAGRGRPNSYSNPPADDGLKATSAQFDGTYEVPARSQHIAGWKSLSLTY